MIIHELLSFVSCNSDLLRGSRCVCDERKLCAACDTLSIKSKSHWKKFKFPLVSMSRAFVVRALTGLFIQWQFACWHNVQTSETIFIRFNQRRFATCALLAPCFNCMKLNLDFGVVVELSFSDKIFISSTEEWHLALLPERECCLARSRRERRRR